MRPMSSDVRIVCSESRYLGPLYDAFDRVARGRRYLVHIEAPSIEELHSFVAENQRRGGVQFFAVHGRLSLIRSRGRIN